jgi:hypothetical protein
MQSHANEAHHNCYFPSTGIEVETIYRDYLASHRRYTLTIVHTNFDQAAMAILDSI